MSDADVAPAHQDKVAKLVDAALAEFARAGPAGARVDAIAAAAGMNKRLLYHYVGDKDALFEAAVRAACDRLAGTAPGDPLPAWRLVCHASAVGRCPDLRAVAARHRASVEAADATLDRLARMLVSALLPELVDAVGADSVVGPPAADASGTPAKPRVKLRPNLSPRSDG